MHIFCTNRNQSCPVSNKYPIFVLCADGGPKYVINVFSNVPNPTMFGLAMQLPLTLAHVHT